MLVDSSNSTAGSAVTGAIRQAAQATGTSFQYLLATAQVESGLNPQAGAATSSARGLFQFIEQTWLGTMKQSGAALGYGHYADAITKTASGRYEVSDPGDTQRNPEAAQRPDRECGDGGRLHASQCAALLSQKLGRSPSESELYIAHFLGAGGAARLISLAAGNPQASAASFFPIAAHANASIFYDRATGAPRSLAQVRDILTARYDVAARQPGPAVATAQAVPQPSPAMTASAMTAPATAPAMTAAGTIYAPAVHSVHTIPILSSGASASSGAAGHVAAVPDTAGMTSAFAAAMPQRHAA